MILTGAYEGKECAVIIYTWVPSKYEFKPAQLPYKESARSISGLCDAIKCMCIHKLLASSVHSVESSSIHDGSDYFQKCGLHGNTICILMAQ